jgi:hypothetical protein
LKVGDIFVDRGAQFLFGRSVPSFQAAIGQTFEVVGHEARGRDVVSAYERPIKVFPTISTEKNLPPSPHAAFNRFVLQAQLAARQFLFLGIKQG